MKILLLALTFAASSAFADQQEQNIEQLKQHISANIDQKISLLQTLKSCVQSSKAKEDLKKCRETHKAAMKKLHQENKQEREAFKKEMKGKKKGNKDKKEKED